MRVARRWPKLGPPSKEWELQPARLHGVILSGGVQ